jgi:hypothetical protein
VLEIEISFIPVRKVNGNLQEPWEVAAAVIDGKLITVRSRTSCECDLARRLVALGVPDQPWCSFVNTDERDALTGRVVGTRRRSSQRGPVNPPAGRMDDRGE